MTAEHEFKKHAPASSLNDNLIHSKDTLSTEKVGFYGEICRSSSERVC